MSLAGARARLTRFSTQCFHTSSTRRRRSFLASSREGPRDEGQEPEALLQVVLADEIQVVYPFPDARDLRHDALRAEEAHELVDGEVVAADVDLPDDEDPGYLLELLAEGDRGDLDRDFPQGRHDLRDVLLGDSHQLAPAPIEQGHRLGGIGGAGPERVLHVLHVVADREREPHVLGEVGPELGIGVVGAHRHHDYVLEAHVAEEVFEEDEVLPGPAGAGRDGHEEDIELVLAVLLRGEVTGGPSPGRYDWARTPCPRRGSGPPGWSCGSRRAWPRR